MTRMLPTVELPRLRARSTRRPKAIAAVVDVEYAGERYTALFSPEHPTPVFAALDDVELERLADTHNSAAFTFMREMLARPRQQRWPLVAEETLESMLRSLAVLHFEWLWRSRRERQPLKVREVLRDPSAVAELCARDDKCTGLEHVWLTILDAELEVAPIWHLNRITGNVVPPQPLLAERQP